MVLACAGDRGGWCCLGPGDEVICKDKPGDKGMGQSWHVCKPHSLWKKIPAEILVPSPIHPPQPVARHGRLRD